MDLERMTAKVRPRKGWEAIDLGMLLVQQHAAALYQIWFLTTLPVFLLSALLFIDYSIWPYIGFWLLKPLWERPMLHFLSRELFGERLSVKHCVKAFFSLAKIQWFASLTWRRLSFTRSLDLPIIQLEGLSGNDRSQRLKVIHSLGSGAAVWLTICFVTLEVIFYFAVLMLGFLFLPVQVADSIDLWDWLLAESETPMIDLLMNLLSYLAVSLVAPFFTACGFALYLNQRTHLEAWDIELAFKRLAKRLNNLDIPTARLASWIMTIGFATCLYSAQPLQAEENFEEAIAAVVAQTELPIENDLSKADQPNLSPHQLTRQQIEQVLQGEVFNQKEKSFRYERRVKSADDRAENDTKEYSSLWYWIGRLFSILVEFSLWVILAVLVIFLLARYRHLIMGLKAPQKTSHSRPKKLFGLDMNRDTLPSKPWLVALELLEKNRFREATSLLYRASLIWYIDHTPVIIKEGDTEMECLDKVTRKEINAKSAPHAAEFIRQLTDKWRKLAYAHQQPDKDSLIQLCEQWPALYFKAVPSQDGSISNPPPQVKHGH